MVIDSSIFIEHLRSNDKKNTSFASINTTSPLYISTVILFEVYSGANTPEKITDLEELFKDMTLLPFEKEDAIIASEILKILKKKQLQLEFRDIMIAATAIRYNLPIKTLNKKHFTRIEGLQVL